MNKRVKRIIAIALTISAFSSIQPVNYFNFTATKAYAASTYMSDLKVNKAAGSKSITMYKDTDYDRSTEFKSSIDEYYVKTSESSINLTFDDEDRYVTYVFKDNGKTASPFESGEEIQLAKGDNTIYVRTYKSTRFDKNNVKNDVVDEYEIHVERKTSSSDSDVYLSNISLDYGKISFSKTKTSYDVDVNASVDEIEITAKPSNDSYTVRIDGNEVDDSDDYTDIVDLKKGKNEIEIEIRDEDDNENIYALNIYRGGKDSSSNSSDISGDAIYLDDLSLNDGDIELNFSKKVSTYDIKVNSSVDQVKIKAEPEDEDYVVRVNNKMVNSDYERTVPLEDNKINEVKVKVANDDEEKIYTLNITRGIVSTTDTDTTTSDQNNKWVKDINGKWKYYDENGNLLKSQWHYDLTVGNWYYLEDDGYMKTGWLFNSNKWYLLDGNGAMKVGWVNDHGTWYYLNSDGSMKTGWLEENSKKYYLNSNGTMQTGTKMINGKSYSFDESGALIK